MDDVCVMEIGFGALLTLEEERSKNDLVVKLSKLNVENSITKNETTNKEYDEGTMENSITKNETTNKEYDEGQKERPQTKDNEDWSPNAINSLLNAWRDHYKNENECSKLDMDCTWKEVSKEVSRRSGCLKKPKDLEQCKLKLKAMKGRYNREKMAKKFNPNEPSSWEWYNAMNTLLSGTSCSMDSLMDTKKNLIDKYKEETFQETMSNSKPLDYYDEQSKVLLVDEIKENLMFGEQSPLIQNGTIIDRKGKGTLKSFDSCSDNSMNYNGSDILDQDSATTSPIMFMASQTKCKVNKCDALSSIGHKNGDDKYMNRFSIMELSRSINCNYKRTCIESVANNQRGNEIKEVSKEKSLNVGEYKFDNIHNSRRQDENLATNIERGNEQMALSIARADSEAHSAKVFSTGSPLTSVTSQSGSSYSSKQRKILRVSSRYKYERENQSTRTLIRALIRATNKVPRFKKRISSPGRASHVHEPNLVTTLTTFGATIQQLEKNQIFMMERVLSEQSNVLNDFIKTLKCNDQTREDVLVGLVVRFLLSIFLIGIILYATSIPTSNWIPISFQSNSWFGSSNDDYFSQLAWVGCFVIVLFTQLLWTSFKRRPITPLHH